MDRKQLVTNKFIEIFGYNPQKYAQGPGRVDLLGIHTDYNDGFVLPIAVDLNVIACGAKRNDNIIRIHSINMDDTVEFEIDKNDKEIYMEKRKD